MNASKIAALVGLLVVLSASAGFASDVAVTIYTPHNSVVPCTYDAMDFWEINPTYYDAAWYAAQNAAWQAAHPGATMMDGVSRSYNCHGYAFEFSEGGSEVWIGMYGTCSQQEAADAEQVYWTDGSYCIMDPVDAFASEKVNYVEGNHSANNIGGGWYQSKWGPGPLMEHMWSDVPEGYLPSGFLYLCKNGNPAAEVEGFTVVNGVAGFDIETLYKTESLTLEGRDSKEDQWKRIAVNVPLTIGHTEVAVGDHAFVRLVETETTGKRHYLGEVRQQRVDPDVLKQPRPQWTAPNLDDMKTRVDELREQTLSSGKWKVPPSAVQGAPMVIYTNDAMLSAVNSAIATFWQNRGYTVTVKSTSAYPPYPEFLRPALDADIAWEAQNGAGIFLLVGDANDYVEFTQPWPGDWEAIRLSRLSGGYPPGEPSRDIIPTFVEWDSRPRGEGMPYYNPYWFTDQPYADIDADGLPDVVVGRLPFATAADVYAYATKLWDQYATWDADDIVYTIGNRTFWEAGDGTRAREAAERTQTHIPGWVNVNTLHWTDTYYDIDRNLMPAALINTHEPGLLIQMASLSNRYYPGDFFDKTIGITPWTMSLLTTNKPMLFLGASCGSADYARTEKASRRPPICEEFLLEPSKGAVVWIGPTAGTWQSGNEPVVTYLIEELYSHPGQAMGRSFLNAIRQVLIDYADVPDIVETARSYQFLGDPTVPFKYNAPPPPPPPGGGCPYVYAFDGTQYVRENTILRSIPPDEAGRQEANVSDAYMLKTDLAAVDGTYTIELREFENEHTYLDRVQLLAVDHPENTELMITDEGRLVLHRGWMLPVAARSSGGDDLLDVLSESDDNVFEGRKGDEVILTYEVPTTMSVGLGTVAKQKHDIIQPPYPTATNYAGIEARIYSSDSGKYVSLGSFSPREYASPQSRLVPDELIAQSGTAGTFDVHLVWHTDHALDFAGLFTPVMVDPEAVDMPMMGTTHSMKPAALSSLSDADGRYVELEPGQSVSLSFAAGDAPEGVRSFVLVAEGHYTRAGADDVPTLLALRANRPNPFNPTTSIAFDLPAPTHVVVNVYSVDGRLVATLTDRDYPAGSHDVQWDGRDRRGQSVSSGVYFYTLRTPLGSQTRKMTLLK